MFTLPLAALDLLIVEVSGDAGRTVVFVGFVIEVSLSDSCFFLTVLLELSVFENE